MKSLRRPVSFAGSVAVHLVLLILVANWSVPMPRRQVAIAVEIIATSPAEEKSTDGLKSSEPEPEPDDPPLWQMDNVILTPHVAGRSAFPYQEARRME